MSLRVLAVVRIGAAAVVFVAVPACHRSAPVAETASATTAADGAAAAEPLTEAGVAAAAKIARDPEIEELWTRAKDGEEDDLARLARREGSAGLMERGADPAYREIAVRALAHTDGFASLPWLAEVAMGAGEGESIAALESVTDLAAAPRRATDPEDALELHAGCERLLGLAKDTARPKKARVLAVRALRMLADRGCVKTADIPVDLDAR